MTDSFTYRTSTAEESSDSTHRTVGRIEARNTRFDTDDTRFDFDVDADPNVDGLLGLLVSHLAAATTERSASLDRSLDVRRIVLDVERRRVRSDGGTMASDTSRSAAVERPERTETPDGTSAPAQTEGTRVSATIEIRTDAEDAHVATWEAALRDAIMPSTITPELTELDVEVSTWRG